MVKKSITIVGAGNVGSALCKALSASEYKINLVVSASSESAKKLAEEVGSSWSNKAGVLLNSDIIILALPDEALREIAPDLNVSPESIVVHTAGSIGTDVFKTLQCSAKGVLYPLQTFTKERSISMLEVPLLIEADNEKGLSVIRNIASDISNKIYEIDTEKRQILHVAAVVVSNFVNHLYRIGDEILDKAELPSELLDALKTETLEKAAQLGPAFSQTGPAVRNDKLTIEKQRDLLSFSPEIRDIYSLITESIINRKQSR